MRKIYHLFLLFLIIHFSSSIIASDSISISGKKYRIAMIDYPHTVGSGATYYKYSLPDFPLEVSILEVDVANPYIKFEGCLSKDSILELETVKSMADRKTYAGHEVLGGMNGDFYAMTGTGAGTTSNGSMVLGHIGQTPNSFGPVFAFDIDNIPFIDDMRFAGKAKHSGKELTINNVNATRGEGNVILYNSLNGKSTKTNIYGTEVVLSINSTELIATNRDISCTVKAIYINQGNTAIGENEFVLSAHQPNADFFDNIKVGDQVDIYMGMNLLGDTSSFPNLTDLIGGNCVVLKDGVNVPVTTTSGSPNSVNPRTAAGFSQDGKKAYFCVVDGRHPNSLGLLTAQLADIMRYAGAATAMNFDGGGSSTLLVRGEARNTPADGRLRSVANAFLIVSTAPEDKQVTQIQLDCRELNTSYGKKTQLSVSALNQFDNILSYRNVKNATYRVIGDIGTITQEGEYVASGKDINGYIEAEYNGLTDRIPVTIVPVNEINFSLSTVLIDHMHPYSLEVNAIDKDGVFYPIENDILQFESLDKTIVTVNEEGVIKGLKGGTTLLKTITPDGLYSAECEVKVEVGTGVIVAEDFVDGWKVSLKDLVDEVKLSRVVPEGYSETMLEVWYRTTYQKRTAFIELEKTVPLYGIPKSFELNMISNGQLSSLLIRINKEDPDVGVFLFEQFRDNTLKPYTCEIPYKSFHQSDYPLQIEKIRLTIDRDNKAYEDGKVYEGRFYLKNICAYYEDETPWDFIETFDNEKERITIYPNPSRGILYIDQSPSAIMKINIYDLQGNHIRCYSEVINEINLSDLMEGTYICEIITSLNNTYRSKLLLVK